MGMEYDPGHCTTDEVVPCSFALVLAIVVGPFVLVFDRDGHTALISNEAVVEQVH